MTTTSTPVWMNVDAIVSPEMKAETAEVLAALSDEAARLEPLAKRAVDLVNRITDGIEETSGGRGGSDELYAAAGWDALYDAMTTISLLFDLDKALKASKAPL